MNKWKKIVRIKIIVVTNYGLHEELLNMFDKSMKNGLKKIIQSVYIYKDTYHPYFTVEV